MLSTGALSAQLLAVTMLAQPFRHAAASLPSTTFQPQRRLWLMLERSGNAGCGFMPPMPVRLPKLSDSTSVAMAAAMRNEQPRESFAQKSSAYPLPFAPHSKFCLPTRLAALRPRALAVKRMCGGSGDPAATGERTEEEKEKLKAERELRKAAKEAEAAAKKARKEAEARAKEEAEAAEAAAMRAPIAYISQEEEPERRFGDYATVMSRSESGRAFARVRDLGAAAPGAAVWLRARIAGLRGKGG